MWKWVGALFSLFIVIANLVLAVIFAFVIGHVIATIIMLIMAGVGMIAVVRDWETTWSSLFKGNSK